MLMNHHLFTVANPKTQKGESLGYLTAVLHLAPANQAGLGTVCAKSTPQCRDLCLYYAGRGAFNAVKAARLRRTQQYKADPQGFATKLIEEVEHWKRHAKRKGMTLAVRINGTSDLPKLARDVKAAYPGVQFYDYTKIPNAWYVAPEVHYTFSRSENNEAACLAALEDGRNVTVVFSTKRGEPLPKTFKIKGWEFPVIDGDTHDLRFLDGKDVVVGLRAKGRARKHVGGFVVQV
jgi:hypothetical protein